MKKYFNIFVISISLVLFNSCTNDDGELIKSSISEQLKEWNLSSRVSLRSGSKDELEISIYYYNSDNTPFYLDKRSNEKIISAISYRNFEGLKKYNNVIYRVTFEDYIDSVSYPYSQRNMESNYMLYQQNPLFFQNLDYVLREFDYYTIIAGDQTLKYLSSNFQDIYNYTGDFWDMLYDFSYACENPEKDQIDIYHFIWFAGSVCELHQNKTQKDLNQLYCTLLEKANIDCALLDADPLEILDYLKQMDSN